MRSEEELAFGREARAATLYLVESVWDPDHEAVIRFGGEAPRRRAHSRYAIEAMAVFGSPPPRIGIGSWSPTCDGTANRAVSVPLRRGLQTAGDRRATPAGISPIVTMRHNAMRSFRASATIIVVFLFPVVPPVRARYQCARPTA